MNYANKSINHFQGDMTYELTNLRGIWNNVTKAYHDGVWKNPSKNWNLVQKSFNWGPKTTTLETSGCKRDVIDIKFIVPNLDKKQTQREQNSHRSPKVCQLWASEQKWRRGREEMMQNPEKL